MELKFRTLTADEVECRAAMVKKGGVSLLLYKDARVDQNILDETVGPMNWQRHHSRDNANCTVSIWDPDKAQWIEKEDTGTESNTEAAKGLASDSFKRACFNWGIGRELYTAPFIWINAGDAAISEGNGGSYRCNDRFTVKTMTVENGAISALTIVNQKGVTVYRYGNAPKEEPAKAEKKDDIPAAAHNVTVSDQEIAMVYAELTRTGVGLKGLLQNYGIKDIHAMSIAEFTDAMKKLKARPAKKEE